MVVVDSVAYDNVMVALLVITVEWRQDADAAAGVHREPGIVVDDIVFERQIVGLLSAYASSGKVVHHAVANNDVMGIRRVTAAGTNTDAIGVVDGQVVPTVVPVILGNIVGRQRIEALVVALHLDAVEDDV